MYMCVHVHVCVYMYECMLCVNRKQSNNVSLCGFKVYMSYIMADECCTFLVSYSLSLSLSVCLSVSLSVSVSFSLSLLPLTPLDEII